MKFQLNKADPYQSHAPVLIETLRRIKGPVLEMGSGNGSTILLHSLNTDYTVTLDHDPEWMNKYAVMFTNANHVFHCMDFEQMLEFCKVSTVKWALAFIDQGSWGSRLPCLAALKDKAQIIILHDSDYYGDELDGLFKYARTLMPDEPYPAVTGPPSFLASNFIDVNEWVVNMGITEIEL